MTSLTENPHDGSFLLSLDDDGNLSRDAIVIESGQGVLKPGTVLGKRAQGVATAAAKSGGNTGSGTITMDASHPTEVNATPGVYTVRATVVGTNSATFRVTDPKGVLLGDVSYSGAGATVTFSDRVKFVLTDGSGADFVVGDGFDVTVPAGSGKYIASPATADDGSDVAVGVLYGHVDATSADVKATIVSRHAEVIASMLIYDASVSGAGPIAAKNAQLAAAGIIVR